jgi:hypothetical protein
VPPTTIAPTTVAPTTVPPTTIAPTTTPPVTIPPVTFPLRTVTGRVDMSPSGAIGAKHLSMYNGLGATCAGCHNGTSLAKAPILAVDSADMKQGQSCSSCHSSGSRAPQLFISGMNNSAKVVYKRCSDCHQIASAGGSGSGGSWGGGGDSGGGSWGGGGGSGGGSYGGGGGRGGGGR